MCMALHTASGVAWLQQPLWHNANGCLQLLCGCCPAGCAVSGTTLTCTVAGGMAVGGAVSYWVPVAPTQTGTFSATASVTANGDSNTANNGPAVATITAVRGGAGACSAGQPSSTCPCCHGVHRWPCVSGKPRQSAQRLLPSSLTAHWYGGCRRLYALLIAVSLLCAADRATPP